MKISPISISINVFFIVLIIFMVLFPFIAIQSAYEVYHAAYNYKKQEEINFKEFDKGDTFWGQLEISTDNKDTLGLVAYTSAFLYKPTHMWARKNITTYIPERILVNAGGSKNIPLLLDKEIIDFEFLKAYESPVLGSFNFFSVLKNWLPTLELSEKNTDGSGYIAKGILEGKLLFAKYKVESLTPFVLSTKNPCSISAPEKLWKKYTSGFFWPFAHMLAGLFLFIDLLIFNSLIRKVLKK